MPPDDLLDRPPDSGSLVRSDGTLDPEFVAALNAGARSISEGMRALGEKLARSFRSPGWIALRQFAEEVHAERQRTEIRRLYTAHDHRTLGRPRPRRRPGRRRRR